jgi:hypothetical protein
MAATMLATRMIQQTHFKATQKLNATASIIDRIRVLERVEFLVAHLVKWYGSGKRGKPLVARNH